MLHLGTREAGTNFLAMAALLAPASTLAEAPAQERLHLIRQSLATARTFTVPAFAPISFGTAWFSEAPLRVSNATVFGYRPTTERERLIGQIRTWGLLGANWDGDGGDAPNLASLRQACLFVNLLSRGVPMPEPMLHASGRAGLYWNQEGLYADLEFIGDGRVSYYIERRNAQGKDKHKGVATVSGNQMPPVFEALLRA